jgi:NADPH:quinone reductase-like Zn-dependent oxidoreductase
MYRGGGVISFTPLIDNLVIELEPEPELSSLIKVQRAVRDMARYGIVVAVGPEVRDVKLGQRVLASITAGVEIPSGVLVSEQNVLGLFQ